MILSDVKAKLAHYAAGSSVTILGISGILKTLDVGEFRTSLETWSLIPTGLRSMLALYLPSLEIAIALLYWLKLARPKVLVVAIGMLSIYTCVYIYHLVMVAEPPDCNCLGKLLAYNDVLASSNVIISRNLLLLTMAFGGLVYRSEPEGVLQRPVCS